MWMAHFSVDMMLGIWPLYKSLEHLDLAKAGLIVALGGLIGEGSQILFGSLSDKGYRRLLLILGLLATASSVLLVYFSSYAILFLLCLLTCLGSGAFHPSAAGLINVLFKERRGLLMTIFTSGGYIGLASSQLIFTYFYAKGYPFILALPAMILVGILMIYTLPNKNDPIKENPEGGIKSCIAFFKTKPLRFLYISQVANQSILWGIIFILPDALKSLGHVDWICYGGGHLCLVLGGALMMIPGGYFSDRFSARWVMVISTIISFFLFYLILLSSTFSLFISLPTLFILGASLGLINPVAVALGNRYVPNQPGVVSSFLMGMVWCISEILGPGGVGLMSSFFQDGGPVKALALLGLLFFVQLFFLLALPSEKPQLLVFEDIRHQ